jgi:hypothetical protein
MTIQIRKQVRSLDVVERGLTRWNGAQRLTHGFQTQSSPCMIV